MEEEKKKYKITRTWQNSEGVICCEERCEDDS